MPLPPATTLPTPSSDPNLRLESGSGTVPPARVVPHFQNTGPAPRKSPSIERFLGTSHEQFMPLGKSRTGNWSSAPSSGGPSAASDEGDHSDYESLSTANPPGSLDVIKTMPMPAFPIRVFKGKPPPFSLELQRRKIRWRYQWLQGLVPVCIQDPDTKCIQDTARSYIKSIIPEAKVISTTLLARGTFNLAYNIVAENKTTGFHREYIFRVSLPIWPYYKVESDVATTEFVRHATSIPVPIIYAFDSNPDNKLGFEWMLMEKVQGTPLNDVWGTMEFDNKQGVVRRIASWMAELSRFKFSRIGSIFMRYRQHHINFYIGPTIHERLFEGDRLVHEVDRGPFRSVEAFYDVLLDLTQRHINDLKHRARHASEDANSAKLKSDEASSSADITRGTQSLTLDSLEAVLARADAEDEENEREDGLSKNTLSWLPRDLQSYRTMLPQLCALLHAAEPLNTILMHPDLLEANIFVDNANVPVALIDWERAWLEPTALVDSIPKLLDMDGESDAFYVLSGTDGTEGIEPNQVYDYDKLAIARGMYESSYQTLMSRIQMTRLRTVYRNELLRLKSPLCKAFDRNPESLEQQLMHRVFWPENPGHTSASFWAVKHLGQSIIDDLDDESENETE